MKSTARQTRTCARVKCRLPALHAVRKLTLGNRRRGGTTHEKQKGRLRAPLKLDRFPSLKTRNTNFKHRRPRDFSPRGPPRDQPNITRRQTHRVRQASDGQDRAPRARSFTTVFFRHHPTPSKRQTYRSSFETATGQTSHEGSRSNITVTYRKRRSTTLPGTRTTRPTSIVSRTTTTSPAAYATISPPFDGQDRAPRARSFPALFFHHLLHLTFRNTKPNAPRYNPERLHDSFTFVHILPPLPTPPSIDAKHAQPMSPGWVTPRPRLVTANRDRVIRRQTSHKHRPFIAKVYPMT
jgi:hypothetical protein